jgi:hypothetical protein
MLARKNMTRFFINDRELSFLKDIASLDGFLEHVDDLDLPANSIIRRINIDGRPLVADAFPGELSCLLGNVKNRNTVEIYTGTIAEIAHESITEALQYLDKIEKLTPLIASDFHVSPNAEAFDNLRSLYEGFYWLTLLLDKLKNNFQISLEDIVIQNASTADHQQKFISVLKQLIDSQERGDFVMLSDLLEYEILPITPIWREMFLAIEKRVNVAN